MQLRPSKLLNQKQIEMLRNSIIEYRATKKTRNEYTINYNLTNSEFRNSFHKYIRKSIKNTNDNFIYWQMAQQENNEKQGFVRSSRGFDASTLLTL